MKNTGTENKIEFSEPTGTFVSNYNKVKTEGVEEFDKLWDILEPEVCTRVKTHNTHRVDDYVPLDSKDIKDFLSTFAEKVHKATLEDNAQEIRNILNRCKTERGLGVAIANYIKTLTK